MTDPSSSAVSATGPPPPPSQNQTPTSPPLTPPLFGQPPQTPFPSLHQPLSIKLDETNLLLWRNQILNVVLAHGLEDFLTGTTPIPPRFLDDQLLEPNPAFLQWERPNRLVMSWIYSSLTPAMMGRIVEYNTARDIWRSLTQMYHSPSIATVMGLSSQLHTIKKDGLTVTEYISRLKSVFDHYSAIGELLPYRDKLIRVLEGLGAEYDSFVTSIQNRPDRPPLEEVFSLLHTFEYRQTQRSVEQQLAFAQADIASHAPRRPKPFYPFPKSPQIPSSFSPKPPQYPSASPSLLGRPPPTPSSWSPRPPGQRPQCQICLKLGYSALTCYHRANLNYQPQPSSSHPHLPSPQSPNQFAAMLTTSSNSSPRDSGWYLDLGATHHFSNEFGNFQDASLYTGDEQAVVGNGPTVEEAPSHGSS